MNEAEWTRAGALYLPITLASLAGFIQPKRQRQFAACLLSLLWTLPSLLAIQRVNESAGWWSYSGSEILFRGMPLELYLGWVVLWGAVPQLAFPRLAIWWCAAIMIAADLIAMPMCTAVVHLGPRWLAGEALAVISVLVPALCIARWTLEDAALPWRATIQVATAGMIFLFLIPEVAFAIRPGLGWSPLLELPDWQRQAGLQLMILLAIPGLGAVAEFAGRGSGTPIPYDPPKKLVTSGIYRYCANPMQLSCALVMALWAFMLSNVWVGVAAAVSIIYSAGLAEWDEQEDLSQRFGVEWTRYRSAVHNWLPRWRPYHAGVNARLYIARTCSPCSELRLWIESRNPLGLDLIDAEELPQGSIQRMRYDPGDGSPTVDGVRALGRTLEHLHLGWALLGTAIRLPMVWQTVQLLADASGLGPRSLADARS